ncbi:MAG: TatD family hydrolase, partial [Terriglobia bacterium]
MYVDTHAHLNFKTFRKDWRKVAERAAKADVAVIVNVGSGLENSRRAAAMARENGAFVAACGLHPIGVDDEIFDGDALGELARDPRVVAVGETGLDYYHKSSRAVQEEVFLASLKIAEDVGKPVILHSRDAEEEVLEILRDRGVDALPDPPGVLHCFGGSERVARGFLDLGFYLSFTGNITYKLSQEAERTLSGTPLDRIMIETDCPYLAPVPHRGGRNEPAYVGKVAEKIAEI